MINRKSLSIYGLAFAGFLLICLALFPQVMTGRQTFFYGDNFSLLVPGKLYLAESLKRGIFPWWNPYILGGIPFFADINQSVLYPSSLLFLEVPPAAALNLTVIGHLLWGALGMMALGRYLRLRNSISFWAGAFWLLSMPVLQTVNNFALLQTIAYLPLLVLLTLKARDGKRSALILLPPMWLLALLGGHPQPLIYLGLGLSFLFWRQRRWRSWVEAVVLPIILAGLMGALLLIPMAELMSASTRTRMSVREVLADSVPPFHFLSLVWPQLFSQLKTGLLWGIYWNDSPAPDIFLTFLGALGLGLIWRQRRRIPRVIAAAAAATLILPVIAWGKHLPMITSLYQLLPFMKVIRNFSLILTLWPLAAGLAVAYGYQLWLSQKQRRKGGWLLLLGICLLGGAALFTLNLWFPGLWQTADQISGGKLGHSSFHTLVRDQAIMNHLLSTGFICLTTLAVQWGLLLFSRRRFREAGVIGAGIISLVLLNRQGIVTGHNQIFNSWRNSAQAAWLKQQPAGSRIVSSNNYLPYTDVATYWENILIRPPFAESIYSTGEAKSLKLLTARRDNLAGNWTQVHFVPGVYGYATFVLKAAADYWESNPGFENVNEIDKVALADSRFMEMGARYFMNDRVIIPGDSQLPAAVRQLPIVAKRENWEAAALATGAALIAPLDANADFKLESVDLSPNTLTFTARAADDETLKIMTARYPGWHCLIDGTACDLHDYRTAFYSLELPAGTHQIHMWYQPRLALWLAITGLGWGLYGFWFTIRIWLPKHAE